MDDSTGRWAVTGCTASAACRAAAARPGGGALARAGRTKLRHDLTQPAEPTTPGGCGCARCLPAPLTDLEAQRALRHVSNDDALACARGEVTVVSLYGCEDCGGWVPTFTEATAR